MSATALATPSTFRRSKTDAAMPGWVSRGNWTPVPNTFFTHVMRACSQFEQAILSLILFRTAGDVHAGRPEWVRLSEQQLARFLDGHPNGISRAIGRLEDMGAIESRRVGRAKEYRAIVEAWDKLTPRKPRKIEPKRVEMPEAEASLVETETVAALQAAPAPKQVLVILPGERKPKPLADVCPGGRDCELVRRYRSEGDGAIPSPGRRDAAPAPVQNPTPECGDRSPHLRPEGVDGATLLNPEFRRFYELLDEHLSSRLAQPPPLTILETQFERLRVHEVPLDYVEARIQLRLNAFRSYGLLEHVVSDCIQAVESARENQRKADAGDAMGRPSVDAAAIRKHLRGCAEALQNRTGRARQAYNEVRELVLEVAQHATQHAADVMHLELHLANAETMMRNIAEESLTPEERSAIEGDVEQQVRAYRERMNHEQFSSMRAEVYLRRLFAHARLPRLSLFHAEG